MKNIFTAAFILISVALCAQVPDAFSYRSTVYNNDNVPLRNEDIKIVINVLDSNEENAKVLYSETHNAITNNNGNYFLQIGKGSPKNGFESLTNVLWAEKGEKYLSVKVYNQSNTLLSNGISQLSSVPYALVAKEVIGDSKRITINGCEVIEIINRVQDLKTYRRCDNNSLPSDGDIVYVKKHSGATDYDGGGMFMFKSNINDPDDGGMVIKHDDIESGRWVRRNIREVNVAFYGAHGNDTGDDTKAIQNSIDYVHNKGGGVVYIPKGKYYVSKIVLKSGVSIKGEFDGTKIQKYSGSSESALVVLDTKTVRRISIEGLIFGDRSNPQDMHCFALNGTLSSENDGGLHFATFKNLQIDGFKKDGFRFQGSISGYDTPNQFITMENVRVIRPDDSPSSRALYMHGQNAQFTFINCSFSGIYNGAQVGTNVEIMSPQNKDNGPFTSLIRFDTCTFENAETALSVNYCLNINIDSCWFENLDYSIRVFGKSLGINISNNRFSNASNLADGYILQTTNSNVQFTNNTIRGNYNVNSGATTQGNNAGTIVHTYSGSHQYFYGNNNNRKYNGIIYFFNN